MCVDGGAANKACYDHFGQSLNILPSWQVFNVKFSSLMQIGSGYHPPDGKFKPNELYAIEWALPGQSAETYELWIDDVQFVKCQ